MQAMQLQRSGHRATDSGEGEVEWFDILGHAASGAASWAAHFLSSPTYPRVAQTGKNIC